MTLEHKIRVREMGHAWVYCYGKQRWDGPTRREALLGVLFVLLLYYYIGGR